MHELTEPKQSALDWIQAHTDDLSRWHTLIWNYAEPAWREYRSARWFVEMLRNAGFEVEEGSAGMPTAFCARFRNGPGPTLGGYAEYDAVPGNCQAATTTKQPRPGLSPWAAGHTDPHSALGIGALGGFLAAKDAMLRHDIPGTLLFFGEPAEKVRGSKPIHAAGGYYDDADAFLSYHPAYMLPLVNTTRWDTHCRPNYSMIYTFTCAEPETWPAATANQPIPQAHTAPRAPGANDALVHMYTLSKMLRDNTLPSDSGWMISEAILTAGQATADNLPAQIAQIQYACRLADLNQLETLRETFDRNATSAAAATGCTWRRDWVSKSRPGLANHTMADLTYRNLQLVGTPTFGPSAISVAQELQFNLGLAPLDAPFLDTCSEPTDPRAAEDRLRQTMAPWMEYSTTDDYTEYCWHAPTARLYIGRAMLKAPNGFRYPGWAMNALGGIPATIDPTIISASRTIAATLVDLLTDRETLTAAQEEFRRRTGGGIGGSNWIPPLCDYEPPIDFRWPEYVSTQRGDEWWIPDHARDH